MSHTDASGEAQHVDFRALHRDDTLFLSWLVKVDPQLNIDVTDILAIQDALWVGIEQQDGTVVVFKFVMKRDDSGGPFFHSDGGGYLVAVWEADLVTDPLAMTLGARKYSSSDANVPGWIRTTTALWKTTAQGLGETWAFQMAIPTLSGPGLDDGPSIGTDFKMWYQFEVRLSNGTPPVPYKWPRDLPETMKSDGFGGPLPAKWRLFTRADPPPADCAGDMTILAHTDIGTMNTAGQSRIQYSVSGSPPTNTFFVRPTNITNPDRTVPQDSVNARLWIANWGSQPGWDANTGQWTQITPVDEPTLLLVSKNLAQIDPGVTATAMNQIAFNWSITDPCWLAQFQRALDPMFPLPNGCPDVARGIHQCILAELSSAQPYSFRRKSFWINMDMEAIASPLVRTAQVSVQNLPEGERRDDKTVYLYVEAHNLPRMTTGSATRGQGYLLSHLTPAEHVRIAPEARRPTATERGHDDQPDTNDAATRARRGFFFPGNDGLDSLLPTYRVHAYRETGDTVVINGHKFASIRPQTSFGYWVRRDSDVAGWTYRLDGAEGATLEQLTPNFYKVIVPRDSFVTVISTINAIAPPPFAVSLHGGVSVPVSSFKNAAKSGFGITVDVERRLNRPFSVAVLFGFHRFDSVGTSGHLDVQHISGSLETTVGAGVTRLMFDAGGGTYTFKPGPTKPGAHAGVGVAVELSPYIGLSAHGRAHRVFTGGSGTSFYSIQAGARVRF